MSVPSFPSPMYSRRQNGNVIVAVMLVMVVIMALAGGMINHYAAEESRAISDSLARVRAYWAGVGQLNFMLETAAAAANDTDREFSAGASDGTKAAALQYYTTRLDVGDPHGWGGDLIVDGVTWNYPEVAISPAYSLGFVSQVSDLDGDGQLAVSFSLVEPVVPGSLVPILRSLWRRFPPLVLDICVNSDAAIGQCGDGVAMVGHSRVTAYRRTDD